MRDLQQTQRRPSRLQRRALLLAAVVATSPILVEAVAQQPATGNRPPLPLQASYGSVIRANPFCDPPSRGVQVELASDKPIDTAALKPIGVAIGLHPVRQGEAPPPNLTVEEVPGSKIRINALVESTHRDNDQLVDASVDDTAASRGAMNPATVSPRQVVETHASRHVGSRATERGVESTPGATAIVVPPPSAILPVEAIESVGAIESVAPSKTIDANQGGTASTKSSITLIPPVSRVLHAAAPLPNPITVRAGSVAVEPTPSPATTHARSIPEDFDSTNATKSAKNTTKPATADETAVGGVAFSLSDIMESRDDLNPAESAASHEQIDDGPVRITLSENSASGNTSQVAPPPADLPLAIGSTATEPALESAVDRSTTAEASLLTPVIITAEPDPNKRFRAARQSETFFEPATSSTDDRSGSRRPSVASVPSRSVVPTRDSTEPPRPQALRVDPVVIEDPIAVLRAAPQLKRVERFEHDANAPVEPPTHLTLSDQTSNTQETTVRTRKRSPQAHSMTIEPVAIEPVANQPVAIEPMTIEPVAIEPEVVYRDATNVSFPSQTRSLHDTRYRPPVAVKQLPLAIERSADESTAALVRPRVEPVQAPKLDDAPGSAINEHAGGPQPTPLHMSRTQIRSLTLGGTVQGIKVSDEDVCRAFAAGPNELKLIGTGNGVTQLVVWATSENSDRLLARAFEIHVVDNVAATREALQKQTATLRTLIQKMFPGCQIQIQQQTHHLIVSGVCDSELSATKILRIVRKTCLVPVRDELQIR